MWRAEFKRGVWMVESVRGVWVVALGSGDGEWSME